MFKFLSKLVPAKFRGKTSVVNVVRLEGAIATGRSFGSKNLNLETVEPLLKKAFTKGSAAVALVINCPGGSPVQSALIASHIRRLSAEHKIPVYAFCEDVAASGGYWLACAADEIYADENAIIGSIGVISMGFGFPEALKKLGVERRVYTSGTSKSTNDPFKPEKPEDIEKLKVILEEMHESFKGLVRSRRVGKLKTDEAELFSGAFWTGRTALSHGLVDDIGHMHDVLRAKFGEKIEIKKIESPSGLLSKFGFGKASLEGLPDATIAAIEQRALWSRFGL
jgi:signal peptide peptidase SppA